MKLNALDLKKKQRSINLNLHYFYCLANLVLSCPLSFLRAWVTRELLQCFPFVLENFEHFLLFNLDMDVKAKAKDMCCKTSYLEILKWTWLRHTFIFFKSRNQLNIFQFGTIIQKDDLWNLKFHWNQVWWIIVLGIKGYQGVAMDN
jgi:hypothetical protein